MGGAFIEDIYLFVFAFCEEIKYCPARAGSSDDNHYYHCWQLLCVEFLQGPKALHVIFLILINRALKCRFCYFHLTNDHRGEVTIPGFITVWPKGLSLNLGPLGSQISPISSTPFGSYCLSLKSLIKVLIGFSFAKVP